MNIRFAYWMPFSNDGYVISKNPQLSDWDFDDNMRLAQTALEVGFDYGFAPAHQTASHGWEYQPEDVTITAALATRTKKLKLVGAVHPDLSYPEEVAKMGAVIDFLSEGRFGINVLSGWFRDEYRTMGASWLINDDEIYRRSEEFIQVVKGMWTEDPFSFQGDSYSFNEVSLQPKPVSNPHPEIFFGGNSKAARRTAARVSDWYLMNGNDIAGVREQILEVSAKARKYGRQVKFALNAFILVRPTEAEANRELEQIIAQTDTVAVKSFTKQVKYVQASTSDRIRLLASDLTNLAHPHEGFKSGLIGTAEQVAEKIGEYNEVGVDMILCSFLDYTNDLTAFGQTVIPLVQKTQAGRYGSEALVA